MKRGKYATVKDEGGARYREIANAMTVCGFKMKHSSARNYVLRAMKKIAQAICDARGLHMSDCEIENMCKLGIFQEMVGDTLGIIYDEKSVESDI